MFSFCVCVYFKGPRTVCAGGGYEIRNVLHLTEGFLADQIIRKRKFKSCKNVGVERLAAPRGWAKDH